MARFPIDMEKAPPSNGPSPAGPPTGPPAGPPPGPPGPPGGWLCTRMSKQQEILFNVMVAFLQLIPQSTLTTVFPVSRDLAQSFSITNASVLPWLVAAYALSFGTFILIGGRLGDIFGHKTMVVIGYSFLSLWSVVAGLSHYVGYELFFVARGFQGIGASMMVPNGLALLGRTYPPGSKKKILSFTLFGLCAPVGAYLGMIFGALFTRFATWWWSFYTLAVVSSFLAAAAWVILVSPPPSPKQMLPVKEKLRDMDWLGAVTGVGGLVCVQVSLVSAPASGWSTQYIFMLLIIGLLLIAFFVITELKIAVQPLVPFKMLKADVGFVLGAVACGWATFGIWTWFLWRFLLGIKHDAPLEAALQVLPIVPVALIASVLTAWMMRACRPSWTLFWALVAFTFGPLLLAVDSNIDKSTYWSWTFASLVVMPFGMDMSFPAATLVMSNFFPPQQQGVAGSLISTVVNYSISLGLGLASTVEVHVNNQGRDPLDGIRGGWFMGVGLGGLGIVICVAFVVKSILHPTPQVPLGPPAPPASGAALQMTPPRPDRPENERKASEAATISSLAPTLVPDSATHLSLKLNEMEPFNFENMPASTSTPVIASPQSPSFSTSPNLISSFPLPATPKPRINMLRRISKDASAILKRPGKDNAGDLHSRSNSQTLLAAQAAQSPISQFPMPAELDPVYRARGSFESESSGEGREHRWESSARRDGDARRPSQPSEDGFHYTSRSGLAIRDPDGFEHDARPVMPKGMAGEKF
ncbi:uncharacterized protein Z520_09777 [Fonsecaea multimorphosa CBS 102226]|uniref:Major facilitator superfamily (MFS) profile domain-containing protein n=1 Tax=Fonsecaea multimorphosa CBS 102226 TaxID=1442371 RepID=A0A0D2IB63_9EURO|nr:uncharacterized protein Z520_09777 [Fonsecaea multimorphosa CBS 102226]KIX94391.1 hypothetical protein Z520_09777 [Fonsecaea multimorphosa CBS 102226]